VQTRAATLPAEESGYQKTYLILSALVVVRLWLLPLNSSFWLDETVTYWSACKGIAAAVSRSQFWPGQNLVYTMLEAAIIRAGGTSEWILRLPSVLAALATAWVLFRLGTRLFDRETGMLAMLIFVSLDEVARNVVNARSYSIALLLVTASMLELVRWLDTGQRRHMLAFAVLAAAIPYFQYLFAAIYPAQAAYLWSRTSSGHVVRRRQALVAALVVAILIAPVVWNAVHAKRVSADSNWARIPDPDDLVSAIVSPEFATAMFAALLVAFVFFRNLGATPLSGTPWQTALLLLGWLLVPLVLLFAVSQFTGIVLFVPRYYFPAAAAQALLIGVGIRSLVPDKLRLLVSVAIMLAAVFSLAGVDLNYLPHGEDWRAASAAVRAAGLGDQTPVVIRVGLIETRKITWDANIDRDDPLLAPVSKYPVPGRVLLAPYQLDEPSARYLDDLSTNILEPAGQFVLVVKKNQDYLKLWALGRFSGRGYEATELGRPEGITVMLFRKAR
jgi:mannosyltransferase